MARRGAEWKGPSVSHRHRYSLLARLTLLGGGVLFAALGTSGAVEADSITLTPVATGLSLPVAIAHAGDNSGRLFIVEQAGVIRVYDGSPPLETFLDISEDVACCGERGLLGLAFDPDFETNGYFYVDYVDNGGNSTVARYTASGSPQTGNPASRVILKQVQRPRSNHNGGQIAFGPDGYLYVGQGDSGGSGDPDEVAQDINSLLGKIWRLDVDNAPTYVPSTNPFVGQAGADEIWALGLRNPWRFSFDRLTGELFIADVGQGAIEEVNLQPGGTTAAVNYGWDTMEGSACFEPASGCNASGLTPPIIEYGHSAGNCSITGGYRYRGSAAALTYGPMSTVTTAVVAFGARPRRDRDGARRCWPALVSTLVRSVRTRWASCTSPTTAAAAS
jgi:glucose/arabinose dehydrogenase